MTTPAVEAPTTGTTAVVQSNQNVKTINDRLGTQTTRSGQTVDDSFTTAVISSYSNLTQAPVVCALFFGLIAVTLAEFLEAKEGPLEILLKALIDIVKKNKNAIVKTLARILVFVVQFMVSQKAWVLNVMLISFPYFRKPSSKNLKITVIFSVLAVIFDSTPGLVFLFSQAWFLITELRNPRFKLVIAGIIGTIFILSWLDTPTEFNATPTGKVPAKTPAATETNSSQNDAPFNIQDEDTFLYRKSPFLQQRYTLDQYLNLEPSQKISLLRRFTIEEFSKLKLNQQVAAIFASEIDPRHALKYLKITYRLAFNKDLPPGDDINAILKDLASLKT